MRRLKNHVGRYCALMATGGSVFVLQGCDPAVRDTILGGVESAATGLVSTFIAAFFESLAADAEDQQTPTTVKAFYPEDSIFS